MGLFDEIQKHIREAVDEAKRATGQAPEKKPRPQPQQSASTPQPDSQTSPYRAPPPPAALPPVEMPRPQAAVRTPVEEQPHISLHEHIVEEQHARENAELEQIHADLANTKDTISLVHKLLRNRNGLAASIITHEILGPPAALKDQDW